MTQYTKDADARAEYELAVLIAEGQFAEAKQLNRRDEFGNYADRNGFEIEWPEYVMSADEAALADLHEREQEQDRWGAEVTEMAWHMIDDVMTGEFDGLISTDLEYVNFAKLHAWLDGRMEFSMQHVSQLVTNAGEAFYGW